MVRSGLVSKLVEFDQFKIRIVQLLPKSQELDGTPATQPILHDVGGRVTVSVLRDIR